MATDAQAPLLLDYLSPPAGIYAAAEAFSDRAEGAVDLRLNTAPEASGVASGNAKGGLRAWGQAFASAVNQGDRDGLRGSDIRGAGLAVGADTPNLMDRAVLGISFSYARSNVDPDDPLMAETDIDSYQAIVYGDYKLDNRAYIRGMAGYARSWNDTTRHEGGTAYHGDYNANEYTLLAKTGKSFDWQGTTLTPSLLARYVHYDPDTYTESSTGFDTWTVNQQSMSALEVGPGIDATWKIHNNDGSWLVPSAHLNYRYDFIGDRISTTYATPCCGTITASGMSPARNRFNLGGSLTWYSTASWEAKLGYDFDYRQDYTAHSGLLRATLRY